MARKKKESAKRRREEVVDEEADDAKEGTFAFLHGDAKRSIAAVFLFAFAALFILGFFGSAGPLGEAMNAGLGKTLGWGKWVFPPVLIVAGVFLLQRRQSSFAETLKLTGLAVAFVSLLGFLHIYLNGDLKAAAAEGEGGGYVGFALSALLLRATGVLAGSIILGTLFLAGMIVAFNWSLMHFFETLRERVRRPAQEEAAPLEHEAEREKLTEALPVSDAAPTEKETSDVRLMHEEADPEASLLAREAFGEEGAADAGASSAASEESAQWRENIRNIAFEEDSKKDKDVSKDTSDDERDENESEATQPGSGTFPASVERKAARRKRKSAPHWSLPGVELLEASSDKAVGGDIEERARIIQRTLKHFGIEVELGGTQTGPTVTQYTFRPAVGVKLSRITTLSNDLSLALAEHPIRIEAPIPGKSLVGIEVPNQSKAKVRLRDILASQAFSRKDSVLSLALGEDVSGEYALGKLDKMPHVLVAGATNSGKSVCINSMLLSLLYQNSPEDLKFILVDPKRVELSLYNGIPHLLTDVIVENKRVVSVLKWAVSEMERRYKVLQEVGSRDLLSYREKYKRGETRMVNHPETNALVEEDLERLPYIVIVIDEMADLMMAHGKEVENLVVRLAQMARAVGIHLILATQRPSVEVLTGLIKANVTTRIAFQVATQIDSRTILDQGGAEKLLGQGDMLYLSAGASQPKRLQGVFISEDEVKKVVHFWRRQKLEAGNEESIGEDIGGKEKESSKSGAMSLDFDEAAEGGAREDDLYLEAKEVVMKAGKASASLLQRRLRVGYARAARLLDLLEEDGVIGPGDGAKPREVYATSGSGSADNSEEDPLDEQQKRDRWQM